MVNSLEYHSGDSPWALYDLLAQQVKHYHRHYHMGDNTSVSTETAQALLESIRYTLTAAGPGGSIETAFTRGQTILAGRLEQARKLHKLVCATESSQSSWFWDTMADVRKYLDRYDHLHFAHQIPELLCYPIALPVPEGTLGIDYCLFYLNCIWLENHILYSFPPNAVTELQAHLPPGYWDGPEMLCEQLLLNALGRTLLGLSLDSLLIPQAQPLLPLLSKASIHSATEELCRTLALSEHSAAYAHAVIQGTLPHLMNARELDGIFL